MSTPKVANSKGLKSFTRCLLDATCLTAATTAHATTITGTGDNFPHLFADALASPLPFGTTMVDGSAADGSTFDFVDFIGLVPGGAFSVTFTNVNTGSEDFSLLNSSDASVGSPSSPQVVNTNVTITGNTPSDGQLIAEVQQSEGNNYTIALTATTVPEPATSGLAGLGIAAGLLAYRRRKQAP